MLRMSRRLLDYDPITGEASYFHWGGSDGTFTIEYEQDVSETLERNKRFAIESDPKKAMKQDWIKYASIPAVIVMKWKNELGVDVMNKDHKPKVFQLLNSPEWRFLKTTPINHVVK